MKADSLVAIVEAEIVVLNLSSARGSVKTVVPLEAKQIESMTASMSKSLIASSYTFRIKDLAWDICDELALFKPVTEQLLRIRFRFGWNKPVWRDANRNTITPWLNASVIRVTPTFAEDAVSLEIFATASQLEYILLRENQPNIEFIPEAKDVAGLYTEIATKFNIDLRWKGSPDFIELDGMQIPKKDAMTTGLDYLANLFTKFIRPTIQGKPVGARFNPFAVPNTNNVGNILLGTAASESTAYGAFEIFPMDDWTPSITYELRGKGSKVLTYSPELNPWMARRAAAQIEVLNKDDTTGELSKINTSAGGSGTGMKTSLSAPNKVSEATTINAHNHMIMNAVKASIELIGDPYVTFGDYIGLQVFHPQSGDLKSASIYIVIGVEHELQGGMFITRLDLVTQPGLQSYFSKAGSVGVAAPLKVANLSIPFLDDLQNSLRQLPNFSSFWGSA